MNLNEMKVTELNRIAKELKVKDWWLKKKKDLIEAIKEAQAATIVEEKSELPEACEVEPETIQIEEVKEIPTEEKKALKKPNLKLNEITYKGVTKSIKDWADEIGMPRPTLYDRINRNGWSIEEAIETPLGERRKKA